MPNRPLLRLRPREGRRARMGAPWIFANEIALDAATRSIEPGTIVNVEGDDGRKFGAGYYNANSLIAVRLFEATADAEIDRRFFAARLARALALRDALFDEPFYRLVHAEGDRLPGLAIDRFGDVLSVQITTAGMEALTDVILDALHETVVPSAVVLRADSPAREREGLPLYVNVARGELPARIALQENGVRYFADLHGGQKTGWYFDQRDNRAFVAGIARHKSVLDVYCHTGGFALAAARAGATEANGLDSSAPALALAEEAAAASDFRSVCRFVKADALEELDRLGVAGERFDVVICDPPPFVKSRKDLESGARAYRKLARLCARVTAERGFLMLASCSHNMPPERFGSECAAGIARAGRKASLIRQSGAGPDHPVHPALPESAYLKALIYAVE
jgi:23S rRNA (cytosine1962-C5)-methyltransferase